MKSNKEPFETSRMCPPIQTDAIAIPGQIQGPTSKQNPEQEARRLIEEGNALEDAGNLEDARRRYEAAIRAAPGFARAYLNLGNALVALGDVDRAIDAFSTAIASDASYAGAHFNLGNAYMRAGCQKAAQEAYRTALALKPDFVDAEVALGCALEELKQLDAAATCYRRALASNPGYVQVHANLGNVLRALGQLEAAVTSYRRAIELDPDYTAAHCGLGDALQGLGQHDEAVQCYRRALALRPDLVEAHNSLGTVLASRGHLDEAVTSFQGALRARPDDATSLCNLGNVLREMDRADEAMVIYRRALEVKPDFVEVHSNLGNVMHDLERFDEAIACYRRALEIKPDFAVVHYNLGNAMSHIGKPDDAVASYRRALELDPKFLAAQINLGNAFKERGQVAEAASCFHRVLEIAPDYDMARSNLLFMGSHDETITPSALFAEHCRYGEEYEAPLRPAWPHHRNSRDPERRLQIGFVSGDLRDHPVAYFVERILAKLAESPGLSLHAYYNYRKEDNVSARLRQSFSHWNAVARLSDDALAKKIQDDGIDVLVDLSGHTAENRLLAFARKPAPIQASWVGYPGTTGLRAMDYYVSDRHLLPPGFFDDQFTEKLVYLPASTVFVPDERAPPVNVLPALRNGYLTFGSFNRLPKLGPSTIALWSRLLRAVPDAQLFVGGLSRDGQHNPLPEIFAASGISAERLSFHTRSDLATYLALHHRIDICLDTFPYTGGTTTSHALWMGVPTLTVAGGTPAGRQGAAVLGRVGLDEFIASDADDFVSKGLEWSRNTLALAQVRAGLRQRCAQSPSRSPKLVAAAFECALRIMWQRWCAGEPPRTVLADEIWNRRT